MIVDDRPQAQPAADEPTESSPLLVGQNDAVQSQLENNSWLTQFARFQRAHLALPVVFLGFMAGAVTVTTSIQILKVIACQLWYIEHDPSKIPSNGNIPEALCDAPGVQELFARIAQMAVIIDLCGGLITSSPIGTLSAKYGRRPLLIIVSIIAIFAPLVLITALYTNSLWLVFLSTVIGSIGGARPLSLLSTMFVVDVSHNPAPILSVLEGSTYFGLSLSYTLGGLITRWSRNISMVFWVQTAISASLALYIIIAVPESFGPEKRAARAAEVAADRSRGRSRDPQPSRRPSFSRSASMERVGDAAGAFARPFAFIWPRRDPVTGKRNKRLFILCIAIVLAFAGGSYVGAGFLVYSTNRFHAQPDQTGYLLSTVSGIRAVYLSILLPIVLKWGRTWYNKHHPAEASVKTESTSSQFDVHLLAFSWLADSLAVLGIALSQNLAAASACLIMTIFASSANPCISTIVSASVEPLAQGEALAAVTLVRSVAEFLSPIILGSILSSTTNTKLPQTAFFVASICLFLAVGIVVLIRDKDRYASAHDETLLAVDDGFIGDD